MTVLVEEALAGRAAGISGGSAQQILDRIFAPGDSVHLTPLGDYFTGLVVYATVSGADPTGAWHPGTVTAEQAQTLQRLARQVSSAAANRAEADLGSCRTVMVQEVCTAFYDLMKALYAAGVRADSWTTPAGIDASKADCITKFGGPSFPQNPFVFDAASDARAWF